MRKYPSLYFLGFVVGGILLADWARISALWSVLLLLLFTLGGIFFHLKSRLRLSSILFGLGLMSFSIASFSLEVYEKSRDHISSKIEFGGRYHVFGRIADWPQFKGRFTRLPFEIDSIGTDVLEPARGRILINISDSTTIFQRGDRLELWTQIYAVESRRGSGFDYGRYLMIKGIDGISYLPTTLSIRVNKAGRANIYGLVDTMRDWIKQTFAGNLTPDGAALASGFLIGETRDIAPDLYEKFRDSGTLHLLAVSGSNVAVVLLFCAFCLRWTGLGRRTRIGILFAVILIFSLLSYGEPSVVRASVMATLLLLSRTIERRYDTNNLIAAAALIILLIAPAQLFDVGFQLSFVTAWGLIIAATSLDRVWGDRRRSWYYNWIIYPLVLTTGAQLFSAPLIAMYFHRLPIISLVANIIIIPLVSIAVVGSLALLAAQLILPALGALVGSLLQQILELTLYFLDYFGSENSLVLTTPILPPLIAVLVLASLTLLTIGVATPAGRRRCVAGLLLGVNLLGLYIVGKQFVPKPFLEASAMKIPGGAMVLVRGERYSKVDLVITNVIGRDYPVDEKIIIPWLESKSVSEIGRLSVFGAQYDALDDIARIVAGYSVDSLFIPSLLVPAWSDAGQTLLKSNHPCIINTGLGSHSRLPEDGPAVVITSDLYSILDGQASLAITRSLERLPKVATQIIFDPPDSYMISSNGVLPATDSLFIVCSMFEQITSYLDHQTGTNGPKTSFIDLSTIGEANLSWSDSLSKPTLTPAFD